MRQGYRIAICDDLKADRDYLSLLVEKWSRDRGCEAECFGFSSAENFLFYYAEKKDYDILLLDIEMGKMDGVSLAKKLRQDNDTVQIVFITGYSDYLSEGYEVEALHYLMKPVKEAKLFQVLDRAAARIAKNEKILNLQTGGEMIRIPVHQIRYAQVKGNYVTIYWKEETTVKMTLGELEKELDGHFFRAGRSTLVNLEMISRVTKKEIYLREGSVLPLPRGTYESVNQAIINME